MNQNKDSIIHKLQTFFQQQEEITTLYLFGSWAKESKDQPGDIDVAILLSEQSKTITSTPVDQWMHYREKLQQHFPQQTIDLTILNTANPILKQQIFYYGYQVGLRNKEEYLQFRMKTYQQQFDMIHIQQKIRQHQE